MAYIKKIPVSARKSKSINKSHADKKVISYRWQVGYYDYNGKRHRRNFLDKKAAEIFKSRIELEQYRISVDLELPLKENLKFNDMVDEYLDIIDKQKKSRTIDREKNVFAAFEVAISGNIRIRDIKPETIHRYVAYRIDDIGVKPVTVNTELRTLKTFFNILIKHEYVHDNPIIGIKMLPVEKTTPRIFSDKEVKALLKVTKNDQDYHDLILMYLHTGARREELLPGRLKWKHIDFESKTIRLTGKFDKSRYVPLDDTAFEIVSRRNENAKDKPPFDFDYHYMYKRIKKYMVKAKIPDGTLHSLRRSYASKLIQKGTSIHYVSRLLGHSKIDITDQAYIHVVTNDLRKEVAILDESW